jgi:hypothetical protein
MNNLSNEQFAKMVQVRPYSFAYHASAMDSAADHICKVVSERCLSQAKYLTQHYDVFLEDHGLDPFQMDDTLLALLLERHVAKQLMEHCSADAFKSRSDRNLFKMKLGLLGLDFRFKESSDR